MSYSTYTSILLILPGLPQTSTAEGYTETVSIIQSHQSRADSIIDSKCARRYSVPFATTPTLIQTISEDLTSYFAYRSFFTQDNQNKNEYYEEIAKNALELLEEIRAGKIDLVDSSGNVVDERATTDSELIDTSTDYQSFFDIDSTTSWGFNSDEIDSVGDNR